MPSRVNIKKLESHEYLSNVGGFWECDICRTFSKAAIQSNERSFLLHSWRHHCKGELPCDYDLSCGAKYSTPEAFEAAYTMTTTATESEHGRRINIGKLIADSYLSAMDDVWMCWSCLDFCKMPSPAAEDAVLRHAWRHCRDPKWTPRSYVNTNYPTFENFRAAYTTQAVAPQSGQVPTNSLRRSSNVSTASSKSVPKSSCRSGSMTSNTSSRTSSKSPPMMKKVDDLTFEAAPAAVVQRGAGAPRRSSINSQHQQIVEENAKKEKGWFGLGLGVPSAITKRRAASPSRPQFR